MKRVAVGLLILFGCAAAIAAQTSSSPDQSSQNPTAGSASPSQPSSPAAQNPPQTGQQSGGSAQSSQSTGSEPVPYAPDEFPPWARQLRRGEIITIGSFPITLLISSLTFQLARYAQNGFSREYTPSLLGASAVPLTNQQKIGVILGAAGLSVAVALLDFTLGKIRKSK